MTTRVDHYVPRMLLRRFLPPGAAELLQVTLPTGHVARRAPAAVCCDDGHDAVYGPDRELNERASEVNARGTKAVEDRVAPALARLHAGNPEPTDIGACLFLAGRMLAVAPYRRTAKAVTFQRFGLSPWTRPEDEWGATGEFCRILASQPWSLMTASGTDGEEFITSDAPIAPLPLQDDERLRLVTFNAALLGAAWNLDDAPLVFPLGRRLALVRNGCADLYRPASRSEVGVVNAGIANFALHRTEWLVAHRFLPIVTEPAEGDAAMFPLVLAPTGEAVLPHRDGFLTVSAWARGMRAEWRERGRIHVE